MEKDFEKIGTKMPYKNLPEGYFDTFALKTMAEIAKRKKKRRNNGIRIAIGSVAAVACLCVVMVNNIFLPSNDSAISLELTTYASNRNNLKVEQFINNLSDEELTTLMSSVELEDDFYLTF